MRPASVSGIVTVHAPVATVRTLGTRMLELGAFPFSSDFAYDPVTKDLN